MAQPALPEAVCPIIGLLSAWPALFERAKERLCARFGPLLTESEVMPFDYTDYYTPTMGDAILRKFLAFHNAASPDTLAQTKLWTNSLEAILATPEFPVARPINIDPGYLTPGKLVLATAKDHAHRVYLERGIYAEVTLIYRNGAFHPTPWTYPDYRTPRYREFFESVRADFLRIRKAQRNNNGIQPTADTAP